MSVTAISDHAAVVVLAPRAVPPPDGGVVALLRLELAELLLELLGAARAVDGRGLGRAARAERGGDGDAGDREPPGTDECHGVAPWGWGRSRSYGRIAPVPE